MKILSTKRFVDCSLFYRQYFSYYLLVEQKEETMAKKYYPRKPYEVNHYKVGYHAIKRMKQRGVGKGDLGYNLHKKPILITQVKFRYDGKPSYERYTDNQIVSAINPRNRRVITVHWFHWRRLVNLLRRTGKHGQKQTEH